MREYVQGCFEDTHPETSSHRPGVWQPEEPPVNQEVDVGKVYSACELAHELMDRHGMEREEVATWVCIAQHESNFNTSAVGRLNADGSEDHGLFQISDLFWCDDKPLGCAVTCAQLRDSDITDDVKCIRKIHAEHERLSGDGFTAWTVYNLYCRGDMENYVSGCGLRSASGPKYWKDQGLKKETRPVVNQLEITTKKPSWNNRPETTRKQYVLPTWRSTTTTTTTTTQRPTFTYPTRPATTRTTTKKLEFLSKRPWLETTSKTTTTTKPPKTVNSQRDQVDFSVYDFFLKGTKFSGQNRNTPLPTTTTFRPRTTETTRKYSSSPNYFHIVPTTSTLRAKEVERPTTSSVTVKPTTTKSPPTPQENSKDAAFNIFAFYLRKPTEQKKPVDRKEANWKEEVTTKRPVQHHHYQQPTQRTTVEATTTKGTTFDPFSVYKFNRGSWTKSTEGVKWTTTTQAPRRNLIRSVGDVDTRGIAENWDHHSQPWGEKEIRTDEDVKTNFYI